jgi:hypothetical protein
MTVGLKTYRKLMKVEARARALGMQFASPKTYYEDRDFIVLSPIEQELPLYIRDAELFTGDVDQVAYFLRGIEWARQYDSSLMKGNDNRRLRKEQDYRNTALKNILANKETVAQ